ncbi:MAG: hypothetical protein JWM16_1048 [Verrucomicrobiales bacterium]|nr:hypothetical protein [Verrucomicrobiales bacterium]
MKQSLVVGLMTLMAASLFAADADDVKAASKKLAGSNYSWKMTTENAGGGGGGGGRGRMGPTDGQIDKDGTILLKMTRGDTTMEAVLKGKKGAIKAEDSWTSLETAGEGDAQSPARFIARRLQSYKAPADEAQDLAGKVKELKKSDDTYSGDLTEAGVKELLTRFPRRGGADAPSPTDAKGSAKFWVKDGVLSKYEYNVQGTMEFNNNEVKINRTTTVEIKDVGTTKVQVPEEAKKKLS